MNLFLLSEVDVNDNNDDDDIRKNLTTVNRHKKAKLLSKSMFCSGGCRGKYHWYCTVSSVFVFPSFTNSERTSERANERATYELN